MWGLLSLFCFRRLNTFFNRYKKKISPPEETCEQAGASGGFKKSNIYLRVVNQKSNSKKTEIDSINVLLEECIMAFPVSSFIISLYKQYQQRGSLSKKQLQGLYDKASGINDLAPGKLAAVEAIIKRMPTRFKSAIPENKPLYEKDKEVGEMIDFILSKNSNHKRVLFLKAKYENNETLTPAEIAELKRFFAVFNK